MSVKTQEKHMKRLAELVSKDLSYIGGPRESGPNGEKKEYLSVGKTFLRALAKDMGLQESKVYDIPRGIGVNGEIVLMGMWNNGKGIYVLIHENDFTGCIMYRSISHMKDHRGGRNRHLPRGVLLRGYGELVERFLEVKKEGGGYANVA